MTLIYGLREKGTTEIRYVGRTGLTLAARLLVHNSPSARQYPPLRAAWLREAGEIEIVLLTKCDPEFATALERHTVEILHAAGHRLTNSHLMPRERAA